MNVLYCQINDKSLNSETLNIKTIYLIKLLKLQQLLTEAKMCIHYKKKQTTWKLQCQNVSTSARRSTLQEVYLIQRTNIFVADVSFIIVFSI